MIAFDFEYYKPTMLNEAVDMYEYAKKAGKKVLYYSGGTEFITFSRKGNIYADVVIDTKGIAECHVFEKNEHELIIGSAVTLNDISTSNYFPLLGETVKQIADHTSRNKITIGGNINSRLMYREGLLPLLLSDAEVEIIGVNERKQVALEKIYKKEIKLKEGDLLFQIKIPLDNTQLQSKFIKRTRMSKVGYPVVSAAAMMREGQIRIALSGICPYPFRSVKMEAILNDSTMPMMDRIKKAITKLPAPIVEDINGSAQFRTFLFTEITRELIEALEVND